MARTMDQTAEAPAALEPDTQPSGEPNPLVRPVRESILIFQRNLKKIVRVPMLLFFSLVQPMLWLVLFTQIFKRLGDFPQFQAQGFSSYLMFFAPSVLTMTVLTSSFQSGMGMVADLELGMLDKFLISPIYRSSVLVGKILADATRMVLQGALILIVALIMGARIETGVVGALVMLFLAASFGVVWAGLSNIVALRSRNSEMTMMIGILLTFPLLFLSTAMMPAGLLPDWLSTVGKFNPVTYVINTARAFMNFGYAWGEFAKAMGVIALVGVFTLTGATRAFKKATT
ncbi:MAG TPA: ABC transporter permease [Actinomycetota bacterium]|nr:ABC transporter permease [Actinomycetota bacterium]